MKRLLLFFEFSSRLVIEKILKCFSTKICSNLPLYQGLGILLLLGLSTLGSAEETLTDETIVFDIPRQRADLALTKFAEQADLTLIFPDKLVREKIANRLVGEFSREEAIKVLLQDTGLKPRFGEQLTLSIEMDPNFLGRQNTGQGNMLAMLNGSIAEAGYRSRSRNRGADGSERASELEEMVVTATKRSQSLQDTAMAISVLPSDRVEKANLVSIDAYFNTMPGIHVLDQGSGMNPIIIRGLSLDTYTGGLDRSPISKVYFGETVVSGFNLFGNSSDIKLVDLQRVEVLRGSQGTLYGDGAMGGVVRNIPMSPDLSRFEGRIQLGYSNTASEGGGNGSAQATINVPIVDDTLALRAVAYQFDTSGYYKNEIITDPVVSSLADSASAISVERDEVGSQVVMGGRLSALWHPRSNLNIGVSYLHQNIDQKGLGQADYSPHSAFTQQRFNVRLSELEEADREESYVHNIELANLKIEYDMGWATLSSLSSKIEATNRINRDDSFVSSFQVSPASDVLDYSASYFSEELRLVSGLEGSWEFLAGLYYEKKEVEYEEKNLFGGTDPALHTVAPGVVLSNILDINRERKQTAIFAELSYDATEKLRLTTGARKFDYDRKVRDKFVSYVFDNSNLDEGRSSDKNTVLKASVEYTPDESTLLFVTWSEGFRLGYSSPDQAWRASRCDTDGDGIFDGSDGVPIGPRMLGSEFSENVEIGSKWSLLDNKLRVNTAVYQINWEGIPIFAEFTEGGTRCGTLVNGGKARSRGLELDLFYEVNSTLQVNFNASYVDAELREETLAFGWREGDRLPNAPRFNVNLGLEYDFILGSYDTYLRSDYSYIGGFYNFVSSKGLEAGGYGKLNVKMGTTINQLEVGIYIDNLTNQDNITWASSSGVLEADIIRQRPRTVGLNMGYQF